jgi:voltage-gated potassium channel
MIRTKLPPGPNELDRLLYPGLRPNERLRWALVAILGVVIGGTVGYRLIGHWTWFQCLYMTVITVATIGYSELPGMTDEARYFTIGLVVVGLSTAGYAVSVATQSLIQSEILSTFGRRRVFRDIGKLRNHFIICGAGRVGTRIVREMAARGADFVIIERNDQVAERLLQQGYLVLIADATDEETLRGAGIEHAVGIICAASSDAENVYATLIARDLNPKIMIVSRANEESAERKLLKAGANKVVSPTRIGSHQMAQALLKPAVSAFMELTTTGDPLGLGFEEILVGESARFADRALKDSGIRSGLDVIIVAIRRREGEMLFNPSSETVLAAGDRLIAVGKRENLARLEQLAAAEG